MILFLQSDLRKMRLRHKRFLVNLESSNNHALETAICRWKFFFCSKNNWFFITVKTSIHTLKFYQILEKYLRNQNSNYIFIIRKDWSNFVQNMQSVAILYKKLKIFILTFFNFNFFFQSNFCCNISFGRGFPPIPNLLNSFKC